MWLVLISKKKLEITGLVLEESKTYKVDHDATIVEEDGTEVRIAPLDVQYQNATVWGAWSPTLLGRWITLFWAS